MFGADMSTARLVLPSPLLEEDIVGRGLDCGKADEGDENACDVELAGHCTVSGLGFV